jgi:hypothetical protein
MSKKIEARRTYNDNKSNAMAQPASILLEISKFLDASLQLVALQTA